MKVDEREIAAALGAGSSAAGRAACPEPEALARLAAGELAEGGREELLTHVSSCAPCARELQALAPMASWLEAQRARRARPAVWRVALPLAASLLLALSGVLLLRSGPRTARPALRGPSRPAPRVVPGDGVSLPAAPEALSWPSSTEAVSYRVTLFHPDGTTLWQSPVSPIAEVRLPDDVKARLSGVVYWRYLSRSPADEASSPVFRFTVQR